ncbi:ABC transporter ATP-binding protein [Treponema ruminis]|uniref:ABC-2 type transport system ATP-binding protein n=1 Tax=Treponema ruminis TaxID=744515 RepID=A0A7W8G7D8_9SPIR|nr:ABC transporter ATP-binding protein [Treponema ruminis]MBB5225204.1 ABC-2 type transport system ATP-binding protein [Treponema ruminis]QSI01926.1 ABC transporter ATP-binding protein [Treponema ruminis]
MIQLTAFSKSYTSRKNAPLAVRDFSMTCQTGEITGILGLNGAGKTTILKAICARHFATSGEVLVEGVNASENPEQVRNLTGFVAEEPNLPGEYTVEEYLNMVAELHGIKENNPLLIDQLSLEELLHKKIRTLSKGQRERVNFAQALIYNPKVLVLDEPASGLDPAQILKMRSLVKSLKADHTILLSTHLMQEVEALCDRVYIIHEGRLAASGTAEEIAAQFECKNLEEAFFKITSASDIVRE